jgi:hypothetical protein
MLEFLKLLDFQVFLFRFDLFDFLLELLGFFWLGSGGSCPLCLKHLAAGLRDLCDLLAAFLSEILF